MKEPDNLYDLAIQAKKGNEESFVALCDAVKVNLYRTAIGILRDETLALDAVSEAIFRGYKGIRKLREPKYVLTWFTRIIINVSITMYEKRKREYLSNVVQFDIAKADDYDDMNFNDLIDNLPIELQEIISLKYYSDLTLADIAVILNLPEGTVKSRLNRALKQLRLEVENE